MDAPKKSLTDKQSAFLEALLGEARGNIPAAMNIAGYSKTTATTEVVGPLKEEITERAGMMLAINALSTVSLTSLYTSSITSA